VAEQPDDVKTVLIQKLVWLPPVASVDELPTDGVAPNTHCFVEGDDDDSEEEIWMYDGTKWVSVDQL
jgi:hypothetical protein